MGKPQYVRWLVCVLIVSFSSGSYSITESDLNLSKKAYHDEFYQVVEQKLSALSQQKEFTDRTSQEGVLLLAFSAYQRKNWKLAETWLDKLLIAKKLLLDPFDVYLLKMNVLLGKSDYYLAEKTLDLIWQMNIAQSKKNSALELLMDSYLKNKKYQLAEDYLNDQIQQCDNENERPRFQLMLMESMLQQGKLKEAKSLLKSVELTTHPEPFLKEKANLLSGRLFLDEKDYTAGRKRYLSLYEESRVSDTGRQEALFGLCLSYWNLGKYRQAKDLLQRYLRQFPFARNWEVADLMLGQAYLQLQDYAGAEKLLLELTEKPVEEEIYYKSLYWLGEAYYRQKKTDQAVSIYNKLVLLKEEDEVNELYGVYGLGWVYFDSGKTISALGQFRKAMQLNLDHKFTLEAWLMAGNALYLLKHYHEAIHLYLSFLKHFPLSERKDEALFKLGTINQKLKQPEQSVVFWQRLQKDCPQSGYWEESCWRCGRLLYEMGRYEEALSRFHLLAEKSPAGDFSDYARLEAGNCNYNMGRYDEALKGYQNVLETVKNRPVCQQALYYTGWCYFLSKKEDRAIDVFNSFLKEYPSSELAPQVEFWLGEYAYNHENDAASLIHFLSLIEHYPKSDLADNCYYLSGKSSFRMGNYPQAISLLSSLIRILPKSDLVPDAYFLIGESYEKSGDMEKAINHFIVFETAYEDSYLRKNAFERLAQLFEKTKEFKNAAIYYQKVNQLNWKESHKNDPAILFREALCHKNAQDLEKALEAGLKVIYDECDKKQMAQAIYFCVDIYEEKKDYVKAINLLKKLLAESNKVNKKELQYRIRKLKYYLYRRKDAP
jgi:TolA-binding protein